MRVVSLAGPKPIWSYFCVDYISLHYRCSAPLRPRRASQRTEGLSADQTVCYSIRLKEHQYFCKWAVVISCRYDNFLRDHNVEKYTFDNHMWGFLAQIHVFQPITRFTPWYRYRSQNYLWWYRRNCQTFILKRCGRLWLEGRASDLLSEGCWFDSLLRHLADAFVQSDLTVIHTYIDGSGAVWTQELFNIERPGESNQHPSDNKKLALPRSHSHPHLIVLIGSPGLHVEVSLGKILNPKLLLMCVAAITISVWMYEYVLQVFNRHQTCCFLFHLLRYSYF